MSRRGNGEGTITHRKDGRWQARLMLPDGKRKSFYGKTRVEVAHRLAEASNSVQRGLPVLDERQTVAQYLADPGSGWLELMRHKVKPSTWQRYHDLVRLHIVPVIGRVTLARLTAQQVDALYSQKLSEGLSPTTVHHLHTVLHAALASALKKGLVAFNVTERADPPRMRHTEMQTLSEHEANHLLETARGDRFEALYRLALETGMRQGELLAFKWPDVDLEQGALSVRASLRYFHGRFVFSEPKTKRGRRTVPLTPRAVAALRAHRARQLEEREVMGEAWEQSNLVFCTHRGGPLEATNFVKQSFLPLLSRAGLPRIRFHDLRHTAATIAIARGAPIKAVSEMLGHASVSITLDVYSHVIPSMRDALVRTMEQAFS